MPRARVATVIAAVALAAPAPALAEDAAFVGWSALLPALASGHQPSSEDDCVAGRTNCVDKVVRIMDRRFAPLAAACDHDAIFSLSYLRTTEEYRRTIADPSFFTDTAFVNHEDVVFAGYYFQAFDAWHEGDRAAVPAAWREAFAAADAREVGGAGNLLLGMNAHIQRDLPYVLAGIGLVAPDGSTRKTDHDRVNVFLNRVTDGLIAELAARFDPTIDDNDVPGTTLDATAVFQTVAGWREGAWRNAEALVAAPTPQARADVAASIEEQAAAAARSLRSTTAYGPLRSSAARDAFCASQAA